MPDNVRNLIVQPTTPEAVQTSVAFSALPSGAAKEVEPAFALAGINVFSNASAYRADPEVPLLLPEINADHADLVRQQRKNRGWSGCIVTNPNCTATGLSIALKALDQAFGVKRGFVVSLQAISGAGYPGLASMDMIDNIVPYIGGDEEDKLEWEPRKMLGKYTGQGIELAPFTLSAHTNRVPVSDGHTVCLSVELGSRTSPETAVEALRAYCAPPSSASLPSAPNPVIVVRDEPDRPQPRLDRMTGRGMATVVGRVRPDPILDLKMVILSHNTIRGAAGGSLYNAELLASLKLI
jgi:aspartate-semialdehyde dehydrogenase